MLDMGYEGKTRSESDTHETSMDIIGALTPSGYATELPQNILELLDEYRPAMYRMEYIHAVNMAVMFLAAYRGIRTGIPFPEA